MDGCAVPPRKFVFMELFAGMGGFSRQVQKLCGDLVEVLKPSFATLYRGRLHPSCFSLSKFQCCPKDRRARKYSRGSECGETGWLGTPCFRGRKRSVEETIIVAFKMLDKQAFFAMENPESLLKSGRCGDCWIGPVHLWCPKCETH